MEQAFLAPSRAPHKVELQALDSFMVGRLDDMRGTFDELTARLADPGVLDDPDKMLQISKQRADAEEVVNAREEYQNLRRSCRARRRCSKRLMIGDAGAGAGGG